MRHDEDDDRDLSRAFAALRREDAERAPPFDAVLTMAELRRGRRRLRPRLAAIAAGLMAVIGLVVLSSRPPAPALPRAASVEQWTAPTDFLLRTPGCEILETAPRIGAGPFLAPLHDAGGGARPKRRSMSP
jgi:hypothetical protein